MDSLTVFEIPIIDFTDENLKPGTNTWFSASQVMRSSLEANGCFFAMSKKNISMELSNSVFALVKEIFGLPYETKNQKTSDKPGHGYYEQRPMIPLHESVGIDLDGPSSYEKAIHKFADMMWPTGYDHFCETIKLYAKMLIEMDQTAKRLLFDAYGLDKTCYDCMLESTSYMFRSFKYLVPKKEENNLGLHAHTDGSYFTLIHHINNVTGVRVKLKTGYWVDTDPSPYMFLFMAGDALKVWSNDRIQPCEHQVILREDKERYSMGLFLFTNKMIQTQEELVDEDHPIKYKAFDHLEYLIFCTKLPSQEEKSNYFLL